MPEADTVKMPLGIGPQQNKTLVTNFSPAYYPHLQIKWKAEEKMIWQKPVQ